MWEVEIVLMVRQMINDTAQPYKYSDNRLIQAILVSAQHVLSDVVLTQAYEVDVDSMTLSPDPCNRVANTRDDVFVNLVSMKTACFIDMAEARTAANQGIDIQDGDSRISLKGTAANKIAIWKEGWCKLYGQAKDEYKRGSASPGAAILGPFRVYGIQHGRYR